METEPSKSEDQKNACSALMIQTVVKTKFFKKEQWYVNTSYLLQQHTKLF